VDRSRGRGHHERFCNRKLQEVLMRNRYVLWLMFALAAAVVAWTFASGEQSAPRVDSSPMDDVAKEGPEVAFSHLARQPVLDPVDSKLPWSKEAMDREPVDEHYWPLGVTAFLHRILNDGEASNSVIKREFFHYGVDLDDIIDRLPSDQLRGEARQRAAELRDLIQEYVHAAKDFEVEHWRQRFFDLHSAVESGHYVIVEYEPGSDDKVKAKQNAAVLESLRLGRMNYDFVYTTTSSRQKSGGRGPASAIIYVTRATYPKSFELLDELRRLRTVARDVVWARLGVAAQPGVPFDGK
jgi:hypothetical protein